MTDGSVISAQLGRFVDLSGSILVDSTNFPWSDKLHRRSHVSLNLVTYLLSLVAKLLPSCAGICSPAGQTHKLPVSPAFPQVLPLHWGWGGGAEIWSWDLDSLRIPRVCGREEKLTFRLILFEQVVQTWNFSTGTRVFSQNSTLPFPVQRNFVKVFVNCVNNVPSF